MQEISLKNTDFVDKTIDLLIKIAINKGLKKI